MQKYKRLISMSAAALLFCSTLFSANAETFDGLNAETSDTPQSVVCNSGIEPFSANDLQISENVTSSNFIKVRYPSAKEDSTSVYIKIKSAPSTVRVAVYGCSASQLNSSLVYHWYKNLTLNKYGGPVSYVRCKSGIEYQIFNSVSEKGYPYAGLQIKLESSSGKVDGLWSPDSVGTGNMPVATN